MARRPRGSPVFVGNGTFGNVRGVVQIQKLIASLPGEVTEPVGKAIHKGGQSIVKTFQAIAPVSELTDNPGEYRDSAKVLPGRHDLAVEVVVDAKDSKGRFIAKHVEHGHKAENGKHVPAVPALWPSYRVNKKRVRSGVSRALGAGVKAAKAKHGGEPK